MRDLAAWARERLLVPRIGALWLLVVAAVLAAGTNVPPAWVAATVVVLMAQFRLWDDLADRPWDRKRAPHRVMARSAREGAYVTALALAIALTVSVLFAVRGTVPAAAYVLLVVLAGALYAGTDPVGPHRRVRALLVLLKYPAFVLLLADAPGAARALVIAAGLYAILAVHEWRDAGVGEA